MVLGLPGWPRKPFQIGTLQPHNVELETAIHKALSGCRFYVCLARALRNGYASPFPKMETLIFAAWLCIQISFASPVWFELVLNLNALETGGGEGGNPSAIPHKFVASFFICAC